MTEAKGLPLTDKQVCLISSAKAQSELLAGHIAEHTGARCQLMEDITQFESSQDEASILFMRDCYRRTGEMILSELQLFNRDKLPRAPFCLFNLKSNSGVEFQALEYGVRGFFYENTPLDNLLKGIGCVFQGEIWLDRKKTSQYIMNKTTASKAANHLPGDPTLTQREAEVLRMLATGHSNAAIGKTLFISPHTVKTHIYNIYRKIEVSDRLQAALWAAQNL